MTTQIKGNDTSTFGGNIDLGANNLTTTGTLPAPDALSTATGSAPSYSARAWVNFNGRGTIAISESGNVSSITDDGVGLYTVNFTTAMPDANYAISGVGQAEASGGILNIYALASAASPLTTSSFPVATTTHSGTKFDGSTVCVLVFR